MNAVDVAYDEHALQSLYRLGGMDLISKVINSFIETGSVRVRSLLQAAQAGDLGGVEQAAHLLKSNAGMVGARRVEALADRIESLAVAEQGGSFGGLLGELEAAFAEAIALLEQQRRRKFE